MNTTNVKKEYIDAVKACYPILTENKSGSGFIFKYEKKYFLVTALHLISKNRLPKVKITIDFVNDQARWYDANCYYHNNLAIDICVLSLPSDFKANSYLTYQNKESLIGQNCYMLGFPKALRECPNSNPRLMPPAIRGGIISFVGNENNNSYLMLDMISIAGFSGSPVVSYENGLSVIGVTAGGARELSNVVDHNGNNVDMYTYNLTGFTKATAAKHIVEIIKQNNLI